MGGAAISRNSSEDAACTGATGGGGQVEALTQTWLTQAQFGITAGHSTAVHAWGGGRLGAVLAMQAPQQVPLPVVRKAQSVSRLQELGLLASGVPASFTPPSTHGPV